MARTDEPDFVPTTTSAVPNSGLSRPNYNFQITPGTETTAGSPTGTGRDSNGPGTGDGLTASTPKAEDIKPDPEAPPEIKPVKPVMKSLGVVNGIAISLPKPAYPTPALTLNVQGKVDVQILIDETGKVVSAKAASGHPLLRSAAERAAMTARFKPTLLSTVPVKATGVIVYNFTKN
jgi:protein TonB